MAFSLSSVAMNKQEFSPALGSFVRDHDALILTAETLSKSVSGKADLRTAVLSFLQAGDKNLSPS